MTRNCWFRLSIVNSVFVSWTFATGDDSSWSVYCWPIWSSAGQIPRPVESVVNCDLATACPWASRIWKVKRVARSAGWDRSDQRPACGRRADPPWADALRERRTRPRPALLPGEPLGLFSFSALPSSRLGDGPFHPRVSRAIRRPQAPRPGSTGVRVVSGLGPRTGRLQLIASCVFRPPRTRQSVERAGVDRASRLLSVSRWGHRP
jgi:hypothetical protein